MIFAIRLAVIVWFFPFFVFFFLKKKQRLFSRERIVCMRESVCVCVCVCVRAKKGISTVSIISLLGLDGENGVFFLEIFLCFQENDVSKPVAQWLVQCGDSADYLEITFQLNDLLFINKSRPILRHRKSLCLKPRNATKERPRERER